MPNRPASTGRPRPDWVNYGLNLADVARSRSQDPYVQVGAVVLRRDHSVASIGYNGAPSGVDLDWSDREARRVLMIHAEVNALRYCTPTDVREGYLMVTGTPCLSCLTSIAAYGIAFVYYRDELENYPTKESHQVAKELGLYLRHIP